VLSIGELSERTGVASSALRYYEELGILVPDERVGGRRRYDPSAVDAVGLVVFLRDVGFSLAEIAEMVQADPDDRSGWRELARRKMAELDQLIASATVARDAIDHALKCRHGDPAHCPTFWSIVAHHRDGVALADAHA